MERLVVLRDDHAGKIRAYAGFATGLLMTGPPSTLQGGMQECLLNTAMSWSAAVRAAEEGLAKKVPREVPPPPHVGSLVRVEVNYKARVSVPGYYRIRSEVTSVKREEKRVVMDMQASIEEQAKDGKWTVLATGKSQRVFVYNAVMLRRQPPRKFGQITRIDRPAWAETEALLKVAAGRELLFDADVERNPGWVKPNAGGFPWRTVFGEGRISRMNAVFDKEAREICGCLFLDHGVEGAENGGGFMSPDALFGILDYLAVENSRQYLISTDQMHEGTQSVTAMMSLSPVQLPRVANSIYYSTKVAKVDGRKIFLTVEAREKPGGTLYATGEALFIVVQPSAASSAKI